MNLKVKKRSGEIVEFNQDKITYAIFRAAQSVGGSDAKTAQKLSDKVVKELKKKFDEDHLPSVEEIQDMVEQVLIQEKHAKTAKSYILYRQKRIEIREQKKEILNGLEDNTKLNLNQVRIAAAKYLKRDDKGQICETPDGMFRRVAKCLASPEKQFHSNEEVQRIEDEYYTCLKNLEFIPGGRTLANAGTAVNQLANCFVIPVEDSMEEIFEAVKHQALVQKTGGGTGFDFSRLRPAGDYVVKSNGIASGPVSFIKVFDAATSVIMQGNRRGANMGMLRVDHPDILEFVTAKDDLSNLTNFNISVSVTDEFMNAVKEGREYELIHPVTKKAVKKVDARMVFDMIVTHAWKTGEPGVIFIDKINQMNHIKNVGLIEATNPCVAADSLISTENGLERIDSMKTKQVLIDNRTITNNSNPATIQQGCQLVKIDNRVKTGYKDCFKIETKAGYEITVTPDHKILTANGWKEAQDITENDSILIQSGAGTFSKDNKLPFAVQNTFIGKNGKHYQLNLPTNWSRELGLLLGWLVGDGFYNAKYHKVGLVFAQEDKAAKDLIKPIFEKYCNREIKENTYQNGCVQIRSSSKYMIDFLKNLGMKEAFEDREVPCSLFTATEEAIIGFLEGLFSSDGTISLGTESRNYIRLNSSSLKLLKQVQVLLLNLGIKTTIYNRSTKSKVFRYINKKGELIKYKTSGVNFELNISKENTLKFINKIDFIQSKNKGKISQLQNFEFYKETFVDKVKTKEFVGKREVWDITEPLTHSFIANGIIVHNCGEVPLLPYEVCNLGSVNLSLVVKDGSINWDKLRYITRLGTRMLDNVIDAGTYPLPQIEKMAKKTRRIGLGVLGFADMLYQLKVPYNSEEGVKIGEKVMEFVQKTAHEMSQELAESKGVFPAYTGSEFDGKVKMRNCAVTSIAPTGTLSMLGDTSGGIEPNFALCFIKNVLRGEQFVYVNKYFEKVAKERGFYSQELMKKIADLGGLDKIDEVPEDIKKTFVVAYNISPEWHIRMQGAFQQNVDNAISKTINFSESATVEEVKRGYLLAYELGCKGCTVYRDGSRANQVLNIKEVKQEARKIKVPEKPEVQDVQSQPYIEFEHPTGSMTTTISKTITMCPECDSKLSKEEGCVVCHSCGFSACTL